jgi:hypothetical protein
MSLALVTRWVAWVPHIQSVRTGVTCLMAGMVHLAGLLSYDHLCMYVCRWLVGNSLAHLEVQGRSEEEQQAARATLEAVCPGLQGKCTCWAWLGVPTLCMRSQRLSTAPAANLVQDA